MEATHNVSTANLWEFPLPSPFAEMSIAVDPDQSRIGAANSPRKDVA